MLTPWPRAAGPVGQDDLTERLVTTSRQYGIEPQQLFGYLQERNQLPTMFADVRRELAIRAAVEAATVTAMTEARSIPVGSSAEACVSR